MNDIRYNCPSALKLDTIRITAHFLTSTESRVNSGFLYFPNPVSEKIRFQFNEIYKPGTRLEIFDIKGKKVKSLVLNLDFADVSDLDSGYYVLVFTSGEYTCFQNLIKE